MNTFFKTKDYEQIKREKSIATGLVNTYQKDLANKEASNTKLLKEVDELKFQLSFNAELAEKDKELYNLKAKTKLTEQQIIELTAQVMKLKEDVQISHASSQAKSKEFKELESQLRLDLDLSQKQYTEIQEAERLLRTNLNALKPVYEKFKLSVVHLVNSMPDRSLSDDISDDILFKELKTITDICSTRAEIIEDLNVHLGSSVQAQSDLLESIVNFAGRITEIGANLAIKGITELILE